ncbi:MAG: dihydrofolate reductase [Clostridium sp.]|nr:dihydrofolate reductase [Clostridium sp.]
MISIIAAVAKNNIIGGDNKLLWHIPEDLKHFKDLTSNHTIIMGRKTFQSLPNVLPKRHHIVLTKDKNYIIDSDSVTIVHNLKEIVDKYKTSKEEVFVIGGGEIYSAFLPYCKNLYLTKINKNFEGDTYFPKIEPSQWKVTYSSELNKTLKDNLEFKFINLTKKN